MTAAQQAESVPALQEVIVYGASSRASTSLTTAPRAYTFVIQRAYATPEDVHVVYHDVLCHRLGMNYEADATDVSTDKAINEIINMVPVP